MSFPEVFFNLLHPVRKYNKKMNMYINRKMLKTPMTNYSQEKRIKDVFDTHVQNIWKAY